MRGGSWLAELIADERSEEFCSLVADHVIASQVGVSIAKPAGKMTEVGIQAIVKDFDRRLRSGNDKRLHKFASVFGNLLQGEAAVVEHVGPTLQFRGVTRVDVEQ